MDPLTAPAKINLRLKVTGRRPDGYHLLDMMMVKLTLCDEIEFEMTPSGIALDSDSPGFPCDETNTLWKVVELVRKESGLKFGLRIFVEKRIPVAAGLGGGSSDAAALLIGLNRELRLHWSREKLIGLGLRIGADVPFFLADGSQRVHGIGEKLEPVQIGSLALILINPGFPVSTREVYRWWDEALTRPPPADTLSRRGERVEAVLTDIGADAIPPLLENDLETVVFSRYPVLAEIKKGLIEAGALGALMSGSGGTVFGLFQSTASRDRGFDLICRKKNPEWWIWKGNARG